MDELVDRSDSGMVADKFDHDMRGWLPSSAGGKRNGCNRTTDGDGARDPFCANAPRWLQ